MRVDTEYDGEASYLRVQANQAIDNDDLRALVRFEPEVDVDIQPQQYGFTVRGDFKPDQTYELTIGEGLKGIFGGTLGKPYAQSVVFGEPEPTIAFASSKNLYLSTQTHQQIGVRILGVPKVQVQVYKIFENNLSEFFRNYGYSLRNEEEYYDGGFSPYNTYEYLGNELVNTEIATSSLPKEKGLSLLDLRLGGTLRNDLSAHKGIYVIKVNDPDNRWRGDQQIVAEAQGEAEASSPFSYAAPLTEVMLLPIAALRTGQGVKIEYDAANMRITNVPEANQWLTREYRAGWSL